MSLSSTELPVSVKAEDVEAGQQVSEPARRMLECAFARAITRALPPGQYASCTAQIAYVIRGEPQQGHNHMNDTLEVIGSGKFPVGIAAKIMRLDEDMGNRVDPVDFELHVVYY